MTVLSIGMKSRHHIFFILLIFYAGTLPAQQTRVAAHADRDSILIGGQLKLFLEADIPETAPIRFFRLDTIPHFEFIEKQKIDTVNTNEGTVLKQTLLLTSFDSGSLVIPPFVLDEETGIQTDSIPVEVSFSPFDTAQAYHDVKDIIHIEPVKEKPDWTWFIIATVAVAALLFFLFFRKKKKPVVAPVPDINIFEKTLQELETLKRTKPPAREYYIRITDIFRTYLDKRFGVHSEQVTTGELLGKLKGLGIAASLHQELAASLQISDYVKFAKYPPTEKEEQDIHTHIKAAVEFLEKINPTPKSA